MLYVGVYGSCWLTAMNYSIVKALRIEKNTNIYNKGTISHTCGFLDEEVVYNSLAEGFGANCSLTVRL
jgi:hypothetical protein